MKKILFLGLSLISYSLYAEVVKLNCNIQIENRFSEGVIRRENVMATVDINYDQFYKTIKISTHKVLAIVTSAAIQTQVSFQDRSDSSRWDLRSVDFDSSDQTKDSTQINIDRNSGVISYGRRFEEPSGYMITSGNGSCSKVDPSTRRF